MVPSTLLQLLWVTSPSGKKQPFHISRDTCHEKGAVRNEFDRGTEKGKGCNVRDRSEDLDSESMA